MIKDFFSGFAIALKNRPFVKLCIVTFLVFNGFMLASAFTSYVIFFYDFGGDYGKGGDLLGWFGTVSALSNFLVVIPLDHLDRDKDRQAQYLFDYHSLSRSSDTR